MMDLIASYLPYMPVIWVVIAAILAGIEAITLGLSTIWFAIGAVCSAIVAFLDGALWLQVVVFFGVSIVTLIFTRPIAIKKLKVGREKNNIEQILGSKGIVVSEINAFSTGKVKAGSLEWSAVGIRPEQAIPCGTKVVIVKIEGVKLIVEPINQSCS